MKRLEEDWDDWLSEHPQGQFPQSQAWARAKAIEGWRARLERSARDWIGGFQILWKPWKRALRIGYISKGPVLAIESSKSAEAAIRRVQEVAAELRISALIVQPPDRSSCLEPAMIAAGFLPNRLIGVIDANLEIDLCRPWERIEAEMRPHTRQEVRQGQRRGVTVREGSFEELPLFFDLMAETCRRQGTAPNPADVLNLQVVWRQFQGPGRCRLTLAEAGGRPLAGLLCLTWGKSCSQWKKGWSNREGTRDLRLNQLLTWDAIRWAWEQGFERCDFVGMSRSTADVLLSGGELTDSARRSRDFFNLGFGGRPVRLPSALVHIPNRWLRQAYCWWVAMRRT